MEQNDNRVTIDIMDAAKRLGIGKNQAYDMVREGTIPTIKTGKRRRVVPLAAFERLLDPAGK
jgi:excisionase family DNA binding protein